MIMKDQIIALQWAKLYGVWHWMRQRCDNSNTPHYADYGWRWITYDPTRIEFSVFLEDMLDGYGKGLTLDRIDNNLGYSKQNCRRVTMKTQNNNKRNNILLEIAWITRTVSDWILIFWIEKEMYKSRLKNWWSRYDAITKPTQRDWANIAKVYEYKWEALTLKNRAEKLGIKYSTLYNRISIHNKTFEEAIEMWARSKTLAPLYISTDPKYKTTPAMTIPKRAIKLGIPYPTLYKNRKKLLEPQSTTGNR